MLFCKYIIVIIIREKLAGWAVGVEPAGEFYLGVIRACLEVLQ